MSYEKGEMPRLFEEKRATLGNLLTSRPSGLIELEAWAVLCQAVQALQDLFLSDGASCNACLPLVTPKTVQLSQRGRVTFIKNQITPNIDPPMHLLAYLAPEYEPVKKYTDTEMEKMWIFGLGETLKRATLTSHVATSCLSGELCQTLADMTRLQAGNRASLMHLLDVISDYCKKRHQNRPFSHIVMDLHQEAMAAIESDDVRRLPPAMPEIVPRSIPRCDNNSVGRKWLLKGNTNNVNLPCLTKEASTSMEDLRMIGEIPGSVVRPKSVCAPPMWRNSNYNNNHSDSNSRDNPCFFDCKNSDINNTGVVVPSVIACGEKTGEKNTRLKVRKAPMASSSSSSLMRSQIKNKTRDCIGPEFVVKAALPNKHLIMPDTKNSGRKIVTVVMLNGRKLDVVCNVNSIKAGQLFELIIQKEHIEENFILGLAALVAGDFVFLPSDTRISKAFNNNCYNNNDNGNPTLFVRVRFFLPSLRGVRSQQTRHLLYLQLRRSILEHQLPCSFRQIIELNGLALQAEFGDFNEKDHGKRNYFLLEHYVPETMLKAIENSVKLRQELVKSHISKTGLEPTKAEEDFVTFAQNLPHYGGHFYTATWICKDNKNKPVWLYISAQGINLYERGQITSHFGPQLYENFEWKTIQTLCYSKHYLCILPHGNKPKKYKLKMDYKKSYFAFRLASLHHQFFLRLRTEFASLQILSQQFGVQLKDMKNETNSYYKLKGCEFKIDPNRQCPLEKRQDNNNCINNRYYIKRSKSIGDFDNSLEDFQNRTNGKFLSDLPAGSLEKRRGVKMGIRAFQTTGPRVSRSMEAVNDDANIDDMSSIKSYSSNSINEAYVLNATLRPFLPDFQETLSESLMEKFDKLPFIEERTLYNVTLIRDAKNSLGLQVTEGSDGRVYVQDVIPDSPAFLTGINTNNNICRGDQVIAVDGISLLELSYERALDVLKKRGTIVSFVFARNGVEVLEELEKHLIENSEKHQQNNNNKAIIVGMIPKNCNSEDLKDVPMPRSLGLSRKWKGFVRYPVTPLKNDNKDEIDADSLCASTTSDDEQIFI